MQLVEQHVIARADPRFVEIDAAAFAAKNLYMRRCTKSGKPTSLRAVTSPTKRCIIG